MNNSLIYLEQEIRKYHLTEENFWLIPNSNAPDHLMNNPIAIFTY